MINTSELSKIFYSAGGMITALDGIDISIPKGSVVGLLGPNGAGKTTCVRLLSTIYRPTSGTAEVGGYSILKDQQHIRQLIGISPETPSIYNNLSGRRNLRFFAELYDVPKHEIDGRIDELATAFDLADVIDRKVGGYSRGMRQKISLAKALLHEPEVLMLDEPWAGLSPVAARDLRSKISQMQEEYKRTVLITTHNLAQTEKIADKIIIISHGRVIATGSSDDLRIEFDIPNLLRIKMDMVDNYGSQLTHNFEFIKGVIKVSSSELEVELDNYEHTPDIIEFLVTNGARLHEVAEIIPSLEDLYLSLVEEG